MCYSLRPAHCLFLHSCVQHVFMDHHKTVPTMKDDNGETLCAPAAVDSAGKAPGLLLTSYAGLLLTRSAR